jgi:hypothetical protein
MHQGEVVPPIVLGHAEPGRSSYWAVLFLAIVSAVSVLIGAPIVTGIPGTLRIAGLALMTAGVDGFAGTATAREPSISPQCLP